MKFFAVFRNKLFLFYASFLLVGSVSIFLGKSFDIPLLKLLTLPLFFLPGYILLKILFSQHEILKSNLMVFLLSLVVSVSEISILTFFVARSFGIAETSSYTVFLAINILSMFGSVFVTKPYLEKISFKLDYRLIVQYLIIFIPVLILIASWRIYPFFAGDDTYKYGFTLNLSISQRQIIQYYSDRRPNFVPFLVYIHDITGMSARQLLLYFLPTLVAVQSVIAPAYLLLKKNIKSFDYILGLLFLSSPFLLFQLSYSNPQSMVLFFTFPTILFCYEALKHKSPKMILASTMLAFSSLLYHELGIILIIVAITAAITYYIKAIRRAPIQTLKISAIAIIILWPYILLSRVMEQLEKVKYVFSFLTKNAEFSWKWWFVNYYENPDGIVFSYPGIKGLLWYAYLGAGIIFFILLAFFIIGNKKNFKKVLVPAIPLLTFTAIFYYIAEIYPRMSKIAFLPERAWPFLVVGISTFVVIYYKELEISLDKLRRGILVAAASILIVSGLAGYFITVYNRGIILNKKEAKAVEYLEKNTPENSIIFSSQSHSEGVAYFANRRFLSMKLDDPNNLDIEVDKAIKERDPNILVSRKEIISYNYLNQIISIEKLNGTTTKDQIEALQFIDQNSYYPVYFYYSLYRFENISYVGTPEYLKTNQYEQRETIIDTLGGKSLIDDPNIILIRVK